MFDFKLTDRGDIMLVESSSMGNKIKIDFMLSKSKPIRLDFYLDNFSEKKHEGIQVKFDINGTTEKYHCKTISGTAAVQQACVFRLKTELGDMKNNESIGSTLETMRHKPIYDTIVQNNINSIAKKAIYDILPNAKITVEPYIEKGNNRYEQMARIFVYDEELMIADYKARG